MSRQAVLRMGAGDLDRRRPRSITGDKIAGATSLGVFRPEHALILLSDWAHSLVDELLDALPAIRFGGIDIALRIGGDAVHGVELAGLAAAIAETGQHLERIAVEDVNLLVGAIRQINVLL